MFKVSLAPYAALHAIHDKKINAAHNCEGRVDPSQLSHITLEQVQAPATSAGVFL